jgi:hypothetical protein
MPLSPTDIAKLFVAYSNRVPEALAITYSTNLSNAELAATLAASAEFKAAHADESNAAMVRSFYHQMFGHAADAAGANYWTGLLDSGAVSRSTLPLYLALGAQGSDKTALESKAAAALAFSAEMDTGPELAAYQGSNVALVGAYLDRVTDAASLAAFKAELPFLASTLKDWGYTAYTGQVQATGYVQGATVFGDANGNGQFDQGEWSAVTDSQGRYILPASNAGIVAPGQIPLPLLVTGGTDATTGLAQHGSYAATTQSKAVNALSSLHQQLQQQGASAAQASARLAEAFGLGATDVTKTSPLTAAIDSDPGAPAAVPAALHLQVVAASLDGLQLAIARTLVSLAGGAGQFSEAQAYKAVAGALAGTIAHATGAADLSSAGFISALLASSVAQAGNASLTAAAAKLSALATQAFGQVLEAGLANIEQTNNGGGGIYGALAHIGQASVVLQASLADKLAAAMASGHPETLLTSYLGSALGVSTPAAHIADIDTGSLNDAAAIARANSGAGVPAISAIEVGKLYAAIFQRPAEPAGQGYWQAQSSVHVLETALVQSPEFQQQFGGKATDVAVNQMYLNMFGHAADPAGLQYWTGLISKGYLTLGGTAIALTQAAQGSDALALQAKAVAAAEFTAGLTVLQTEAAYAGQNIAAASAWLAGVHDDATLSGAIAALPALLKSLNDNPGPFPPATQFAVLVGVAEADTVHFA